MDAYDKGSDARHGPAGPSAGPSGPEPGAALPEPATPATPAGPSGPAALPPGTGRPEDLPHSPAGPDAVPHTVPGPPAGPRTGVAALSLRYQIGAAVALAVVAVVVCVHLGMTFLHVAPANTVSKKHGETVEDWIYPEFEQNWKLFAPNPLQQNIAVQVRAEIRTADGGTRTTGWYDLSAQDGRAIDGNLLPSHTQQNELRRAWDFFVATHDDDNRPVGLRGALSETYLRRITVLRLDRADAAGPGGAVERVQVRSRTTHVPPPEWSGEKVSTTPVYRTLSWWPLPEDEVRGGVG
ncbi:hypothetical protein B7767_01415 [Streptomyces sp. 13-12-16]|uniref:DUF5819 family protein n=1 Tax=Streptomyces sp. 13-12-16 TaxID=1570823 RepID=UPI000A1EFCA7|nr:DUF5819 family protein [Streptomyces sp. 13-12-16]OSP45074.1 hypothetical protein B7767_01415 [Streptomyces sp. 13-12-16]